jgi:hypothetical protein
MQRALQAQGLSAKKRIKEMHRSAVHLKDLKCAELCTTAFLVKKEAQANTSQCLL